MQRLPLPPKVELIRAVPPAIRTLGNPLWRIHEHQGNFPMRWNEFRRFGPMRARFDPWTGRRERRSDGIMYLACDAQTPFTEVFQNRVIDARSYTLAADGEVLVPDRHITQWTPTCGLRLLDLTGNYPALIGASAPTMAGGRHMATRRWAKAFKAILGDQIDGLYWYGVGGTESECVALFDHASAALPSEADVEAQLSDPMGLTFAKTAQTKFGWSVRTDHDELPGALPPIKTRRFSLEQVTTGNW